MYSIPPAFKDLRLPSNSHIAVLAGGNSAEREISLQSGTCVANALSRLGHQVVQLDPKTTNLETYNWDGISVVFLALHGQFGEDGQVQSILDDIGIPYTGSPVDASRIGISKSATKERFIQTGIPTAQYILIHESDSLDRIQQHAAEIGFPVVVKPDTQGSSIGVSLVRTPLELKPALQSAFLHDSFAVLEKAIIGTEWTVGVLDDLVFPAIRITTPHELFDFQAKYSAEDTTYSFEFREHPAVTRQVEITSQSACRALGTRGIARVDLIVDQSFQPWVLEVNTIPGFTDHSLVPKAAARIGWSFETLCERAVISALKHHRKLAPHAFLKPHESPNP